MIALLLIAGLLVGMMLPIQTSVNNHLGKFTRSPLLASFISFSVGALFLLIINIIINPAKLTFSQVSCHYPPYIWFLGGLCGIIFLTGNILLLPRLGAAMTVVTTVTGQMVMSILIDWFGFFHAPVHGISLGRILGVVLMLLGILLMNYLPRAKRKIQTTASSKWWLFAGFGSGLLPPIQTAVNSQLRTAVDSFFLASLISFVVGVIILAIIVAIFVRRFTFSKRKDTGEELPLWAFIGGFLGVAYVTANIVLMPYLGVALTIMILLCGQMVMALLIDHFGMFSIPKQQIDNKRIIGILFIIGGIVLVHSF